MAHFRGTVQGNRLEGSRLGTKDSGLETTCNGWGIGAKSIIEFNEEKQRDEITVYINSGSGWGGESRFLGTFYRKGDKFVKVSR